MTDRVSILDGNTFVVSDRTGDIEPSLTTPTGLFTFDTRFLSKWVLTIDGERLTPLAVDDLQYFETRFFLVPGELTQYVDAKLSVHRRRSVGGSFEEDLTVFNHHLQQVCVDVRVDVESDFADIFDVKNANLRKAGKISKWVDGDGLHIGYKREAFHREADISIYVGHLFA